MNENNVRELRNALDIVIKKHSEYIEKGEFIRALNIMKNVEQINRALVEANRINGTRMYTRT